MNKTRYIIFVLCLLSLFTLLSALSFSYGLAKTSIKGNDSNQLVQVEKSYQGNTEPIIFDNFELIEGLELRNLSIVGNSHSERRIMQLVEGSKKGIAEDYFFEQSGKYDMALFYADGVKGKSGVDIIINGLNIGNIMFGLSNSFKVKTIPGINIQKWSKIVLEFNGEGDEKCRIEKLVLTPTGAFEGQVTNLVKPQTLRVFQTSGEQLIGRKVFSGYVRNRNDSLERKRKSELVNLKSPEEWRLRQKRIRERLDMIFGEFPERTSLNARVVGKLELEHYTIEKVIYESQPKYYVTANLYVPKGRKFPLPGVLFTCGHSDDGKAFILYHETCLGLVLKGYIVLAFDPMGQGERSEYFDTETRKPLVGLTVDQHLYVMRPAFLADWTLSGLRTWDGIRSVDYLASRPEVDTNKLAVVGNSGGGQMALLITAADQRIKVCAAAHPGGECENTYLPGQNLFDKEILSLIPPRPLRIIVGKDSGEEQGHREKLEDMQLFYEGLGYKKDLGELTLVDGVHNMEKPKREAAYEWLNKWFDKEAEGKAEAVLKPEKVEALWCTESGNTIISLGGETAQTLNAKRAEKIYKPEKSLNKLKERIASRIGFMLPQKSLKPKVQSIETIIHEGISIEKLTYESENGIVIPALLIKPENVKRSSPVYIFASDKGKPTRIENSVLPFQLAKNGSVVLAIDVRGIGETSPTPPYSLNKFNGYNPLLWRNEVLLIQSAGFGRTSLGMRTFDLIKGIDFLNSRKDLKGRKIVIVGEGLGGLWALLASIYDSRIDGVVTEGTLPSYMLLLTNQYYNLWGYFWVPGALRDFDIPDMVRLVSPKHQIWIDPVNALGEKLNLLNATSIIGEFENLQIITQDYKQSGDILQLFNKSFN
jgi:cephalosporin-C deacetylase-like acetyl esterase